MENESFDLDSSWIEEEESRYNSVKERENIDSICCYFIYIGSDSTILKVIKEYEILSHPSDKQIIKNDRLLHIIQNRRLLDSGQRFKISTLVKYLVDIEPEYMSDFLCLENNNLRDSGFLKEVNIFEDVIIEPSIFCFHSIASLYFFFREDEMIIKLNRSILKGNNSLSKSSNKATKKVRILEEIIGYNEGNIDIISLNSKNNITKKNI